MSATFLPLYLLKTINIHANLNKTIRVLWLVLLGTAIIITATLLWSSEVFSKSPVDVIPRWNNFTLDYSILEECNIFLDNSRFTPAHEAILCGPPGSDAVRGDAVLNYIRNTGHWELGNQLELFDRLFPMYPEAVFVDIGGQFGAYAVTAGKLGKRVFSFEPTPVTFEYLKHAVWYNKLSNQVYLYKVALSNVEDGCGKLVQPELKDGNVGWNKVEKGIDCSNPVAVRVTKLDNLLPTFRRLDISSAIIKIDIEGSEPNAILGGEHFLEQIDVPVIQMEFHHIRNYLSRKKTNPKRIAMEEFLRLMEKLGYIPYSGQRRSSSQSVESKKLHLSQASKWDVEDIFWRKLD